MDYVSLSSILRKTEHIESSVLNPFHIFGHYALQADFYKLFPVDSKFFHIPHLLFLRHILICFR